MDIDQELTTLDNLQAAPLDEPHPEQEEPFQHVPEDVIQNVEKLEVQMPQEEASLENMKLIFQEIQSAQEKLKQTGKISSLEAQEIARFVPEVMGTETEPVSFTSIPTSVGVEQTQKTLQDKQEALGGQALIKLQELIKETTTHASNATAVLNKDYEPTLVEYTQAREIFRKATGEYPEFADEVYIGEIPMTAALAANYPSMRESEATQSSEKFRRLHEAFRDHVGYDVNFSHLFYGQAGGYIHLVDYNEQYRLDNLVVKNLNTQEDLRTNINVNDKALLLAGLASGTDDRFKKIVKAIEALCELLQNQEEAQILEKIKQTTLAVNLINTLVKQAQAYLNVLKASTEFLMQMSTDSPNAELSAAMESVLPIDRPIRPKKMPAFARLLRGA